MLLVAVPSLTTTSMIRVTFEGVGAVVTEFDLLQHSLILGERSSARQRDEPR